MPGFAREGCPFIAFFAFLTLAAYAMGGAPAAAAPLAVTLFMFYFFRDPERKTPEGKGLFVSPADGRIIEAKEVFEEIHLKKKARLISIFMSPLDVHVNRSPEDGTVKAVRHTPGGKKAAYTEEAHAGNENMAMVLGLGAEGGEKEGPSILLRQVAGTVARRAVCRARPGEFLGRGQRFGIIKFGSRVDVYLPMDSVLRVKTGDRVRAGETVIAERG